MCCVLCGVRWNDNNFSGIVTERIRQNPQAHSGYLKLSMNCAPLCCQVPGGDVAPLFSVLARCRPQVFHMGLVYLRRSALRRVFIGMAPILWVCLNFSKFDGYYAFKAFVCSCISGY